MVNADNLGTPLPLRHELIRASAGTGKTFRLSNRYLLLLASGVEPAAILATTFSRKGAGEILDRIVQRLAAAALDDGAARRLAAELAQDLAADGQLLVLDRARAAEILHGLLKQLHRLEVSTLDSFFHRVAKVFSLELGLPPTWEIVEQQQMLALEDEAIQGVLAADGTDELLPLLSRGEASRRVATMIRDLVRDIYGIYRQSGSPPWDRLKPLGQRLSDAEREELAVRLEKIEVPQKTIRDLISKLIDWIRSDDWQTLAKQTVISNFLAENYTYRRSQLPDEMVSVLHRLCDHLRAVISTHLITHNHSTAKLLEAFGERLERAKSATGSLRFEDVTERLLQFVGTLDAERLAFRLDHQIQHLLLDEFQDTSTAQWGVLRPLAKRVTEQPAGARSFFCVGDRKQAIFGWRGGVAEIFEMVKEEIPGLHEDTLKRSYRSSPYVIEAVNQVFQNMDRYQGGDESIQQGIQQWVNGFPPHETEKTSLAGHVTLETADQVPTDALKDAEWEDDPDPLVAATVRRIAMLDHQLPPALSIGVLVRTNDEVARLIFRLREAGVFASEEGGNPLTDAAGVELILSSLQLADHPGDSVARFHVSHSPLASTWGLQPESTENQKENSAAAHRAAAQLRRRLMEEGYGPVVESLARRLVKHATRRETIRLQQLVRVAYDVGAGEAWHLRPRQFVESVREEIRVSDASAARVRVMTIHQCKGLEFDTVVFPCPRKKWVGQNPPVVVGRSSPTGPIELASNYVGSDQRQFLPEQLETLATEFRQRSVREALCVLYVALTRAKHALHLVVPEGQSPSQQGAAALLVATLADEESSGEGPLFEIGDPQWYLKQEAPADQDEADELSNFYLPRELSLEIAKINRSVRSGRGRPQWTPSSARAQQPVRLTDVILRPTHLDAQRRGQWLHACFESLVWLEHLNLDRKGLAGWLERRFPDIDDAAAIATEFQQLIAQPQVRKLFSELEYKRHYLNSLAPAGDLALEALRVEVDNERPFAVTRDDGIVRGIIDRLVLIYQGDQPVAADVIEIKTDDVGDALHAKVHHYREQVALYRESIAQTMHLPIERVAARLVFVAADQIVNLFLPDQHHQGGQSNSAAHSIRPPANSKRRPAADRQQRLWDD